MARYEMNEIFNAVYNPATASLRVGDFGSNYQKRLDYDVRTDDNPVYVGYGASGLATTDDGWLINQLTYDGSDRVTLVQSAIGTWDDRASLTYA